MTSTLRTCRVVAVSTFRHGLRGRLAFIVIAAVVSVFLFANAFAQFADNAKLEMRLILETNLALSALVVLGTAILLGSRPIGQGDERHAVQALLALPIPRQGLFLGHVAGIAATLLLYTLAMAAALSVVMMWRFSVWNWALWLHFATLFVEGVILSSIASLLAISRSPIIAFFGTIGVTFVCHSEGVLNTLAQESGSKLLYYCVSIVSAFLPAIASLDAKAAAVRNVQIHWHSLGKAFIHSGIYVSVIVLLATMLFKRTEL